jgi:ATP-dependent Clp protease ATP-binding subunit ClpA
MATLNRLAKDHLAFGGRGVRNVIDTALVNPLAAWLFDNDVTANSTLRLVDCVDHGESAVQRYELRIVRETP